MYARATINARGVLVSQEKDLHAGQDLNDECRMSNEWMTKSRLAIRGLFMAASIRYDFTFNNSTGTSTACRTLSAVAP